MIKKICILSLFFFVLNMYGQHIGTYKYYVRAVSDDFTMEIIKKDKKLTYIGKDINLKRLFEENEIYAFQKGFPSSRQSLLQRTFFVEAKSNKLDQIIIKLGSHVFENVTNLGTFEAELTDTYPNDYGQTGGANLGLNVNLSAYDYAELPMAFDYTFGNSSIKIGISDGELFVDDTEFINKTTVLPQESSTYANGHGTGVSAIAAAQGNNGYGITGFCSDCHILKNGFGSMDRILELSYAGAHVINCSWGWWLTNPIPEHQAAINEATANGSIVVAGSGNCPWDWYGPGPSHPKCSSQPGGNQGNKFFYPASYDNVISVAAVGSKYETVTDSVYFQNGYKAFNVQDHIASEVYFDSNPNTNPNASYDLNKSTTITLNTEVDIMGAAGVFRYGPYITGASNVTNFYAGFATSSTTPQVSGTIGLMKSLNKCLNFIETESILKITSKNVDHIQVNSFAEGKYGSGALSAGKAVKLTHDLITPLSVAYLENQKFKRWNFVFEGVSKNIIMRNQEFTESSKVYVRGKNIITLEAGTLLEPNASGEATFEIDTSLNLMEHCVEPSIITNPISKNTKIKKQVQYQMLPTWVENKITLENQISKKAIISKIQIYNLFGRSVYNEDDISTPNIVLEVSHLVAGIYILKGYSNTGEEIFTSKFVKQ